MTTATDRLVGLNGFVAWKPPCRVATTANITLSGEQTIDGISVVSGDRVLVKDQSTASDNGIWTAATGAWTRASDFNGTRDVVYGTSVLVMTGTTNALKSFTLTTTSPTIGSSSLAFAELSWSQTYTERSAGNATLLAANADGTIGMIGGLLYKVDSSATGTASATNDLSVDGLVPFGPAYADHYATNTTPGTTDMATAINACADNNQEVWFLGVDYAVGSTIDGEDTVYRGVAVTGNASRFSGDAHTRLVGLSASLDEDDDPIIAPKGASVIQHLHIGYDTLTGSETEDQRVGLATDGLGSDGMVKSAKVDHVYFDNCGTAISNMGDTNASFSQVFDNIEINRHTYAGFNYHGGGSPGAGTGIVIGNMYIQDDPGTTLTPTYGFNWEQREIGSILQLNVEGGNYYSGAAVRFRYVIKGWIGNLHIEGVDISASGGCYMELDQSSLNIDQLSFTNIRMSYDNPEMIRLKAAGNPTAGVSYPNKSRISKLKIGTLRLNGLAWADTGQYPSYTRFGLNASISGWKMFARSSSYTDSLYHVEIDHYEWACYTLYTADKLHYKYALSRYSNANDNIVFLRRGGPAVPGRNFLSNGAFDAWTSTSGASATTATQTATGWYVDGGTQGTDYSRQNDTYGRDNTYFMRFSNSTDGAGTFQILYQDILEWQPLADTDLVLSFDAKATVAGERLDNITATFYTDSGSPTSILKEAIDGDETEMAFTTSWQRYEIEFEGFDSSSIVSLGSAPYVRVQFQINGGTATLSSVIDLRNVKLERGQIATPFIRHRSDA